MFLLLGCMGGEKFMLVSLEDKQSKALANVLGNKTCRKIIDYLADEKELSEKDISDKLGIALNTVDYNIKKLVQSGIVEKKKNYFWSKKGRKIVMYGLSNKSIVISPKKKTAEKLKSILPGFILTAVGSFAVYVYEKFKNVMSYAGEVNGQTGIVENAPVLLKKSAVVSDASLEVVSKTNEFMYYPPSDTWVWFLAGGLLVLFVYSWINWKKL
jgi:DNA-binding transcriptional ArsR family regulator